jgi:hypothetical protein
MFLIFLINQIDLNDVAVQASEVDFYQPRLIALNKDTQSI